MTSTEFLTNMKIEEFAKLNFNIDNVINPTSLLMKTTVMLNDETNIRAEISNASYTVSHKCRLTGTLISSSSKSMNIPAKLVYELILNLANNLQQILKHQNHDITH